MDDGNELYPGLFRESPGLRAWLNEQVRKQVNDKVRELYSTTPSLMRKCRNAVCACDGSCK
mgnify:CR=1 FL=1